MKKLALAILLTAVLRAPGQAATLPFVPPTNWQPLPTAFLPHPITSWNNGLSNFSVATLATELAPGQLNTIIKAEASLLGTVTAETANPICGQPAEEAVVDLKNAPQMLIEHVQLIDGKTYVLTYSRPRAAPPDAAIAATMSGFCGEKSVATLEPPKDWTVSDAQLLGIWVGTSASQVVTLTSSKPATDAQKLAVEAAQTAFKGASVKVVSNKTGLLCGLPATFFTADVSPNGAQPSVVSMEMTESPTIAYVLLYSHPVSTGEDPDANVSLKSLCANSRS